MKIGARFELPFDGRRNDNFAIEGSQESEALNLAEDRSEGRCRYQRSQPPKLFERCDIIVEVIHREKADVVSGELLLKLLPGELR